MAVQLEWDEFETALLIEAAEEVLKNPSTKKEVAKNLSHALRHRALNHGIRIDNVFRNINGISLQMTKTIYLLTNGGKGLPGASKIFVDMAALKKEKPSEFTEVLNIARQQVQNEKFKIFENNKDKENTISTAASTLIKADTPDIENSSSEMEDKNTLEDKLYVVLKQECESNQYGATLDFLAGRVNAAEKEIKSILSQVEWASLKYGRYTISANDSNEYQTYDFLKNPSLSFTKPVKTLYFDEIVSQATTWRQLYLDFLKVLYEDYPHVFQGIIGKIFPHFSSPLVGNETHITQFRKPGEFAPKLYVETNISAHDTVSNLKKFLDLCNVDYENVVITYERKNTEDITVQTITSPSGINYSRMLNSLNETLEYLRKRYNVRMSYNHYDDPKSSSNDMLYKANNGKKDVIWVYFLYSQRSRYISIETEPEYLKNTSALSKGFTKTMLRASHPRLKMFFERYESISKTLVRICDSIDVYFEREALREKETSSSQVKLYQKLYAISNVYNNPNGISVDRILQLITFDVSAAAVEEMLNRVSWATKVSDGVYSFARGAATKLQPTPVPLQPKEGEISEDAFYYYLRYNENMAESTCRGYISAINTIGIFTQKKRYLNQSFFDSSPQQIIMAINQLKNDAEYIEYNRNQHNRFSAALTKLSSFFTKGRNQNTAISAPAPQKEKEENVCPSDFNRDKYITVLIARYRSGMRFDSIDFENFRDIYEDMYDEGISFDDDALKKRLLFCGVYYKDRLFPAEGIIDAETRKKLFQYIEKVFATGKKVIYYKAILTDMADAFVYCFNLNGEDMLKAYMEYTAPKGKYFFHKDYLSAEQEVEVDHSAEIINYILSVGKPLKLDEICAGLSHISSEVVKKEIRGNNDFQWDAKGYYFHIDSFEISDDERNQISGFIDDEIEKEGYALWPRIYDRIADCMPIFLENNAHLSSLGIRNAVARKLSMAYSFESAIISTKSSPLDTFGVFRMYAKHHRTFTADDIYQFAKEFGSVVYYDALAEESVRLNRDLFIAKDMVSFDVEAIDHAISTYFSGEYVLMKDMDSFLVFPGIGYTWNQFILESFINGYSRNYRLINNGYSRNIVPGAIVKKNSRLTEFVDIVAAVLADSNIELKESFALPFLAENNLIVNKRYGDIGVALEKARRIRNRKG